MLWVCYHYIFCNNKKKKNEERRKNFTLGSTLYQRLLLHVPGSILQYIFITHVNICSQRCKTDPFFVYWFWLFPPHALSCFCVCSDGTTARCHVRKRSRCLHCVKSVATWWGTVRPTARTTPSLFGKKRTHACTRNNRQHNTWAPFQMNSYTV